MTDRDSLFGEKPLSAFYDGLSCDPVVKVAVGKVFGTTAQDVLDGMRRGDLSPDQGDELSDLLLDLLFEQGELAAEYVGKSDFDEFSINVMRFGPIFWIEAPEFDDIGYFDNLVVVSEVASSNYEPFITHAAEQSREED